LSVSIALTLDPAWDEKSHAWVDVKKKSISAHGKIYQYGSSCYVEIISAQTHNSSLHGEPKTWPTTAELSKK
jgi:hypothetical protein